MLTISKALLESEIEHAEAISKGFEKHNSEVFVAVLISGLMGKAVGTLNSAISKEPTDGTEKGLAPGELFARLRPDQDTTKVLVAAYFLDVVRHEIRFTAQSLRSLIIEAKTAAPKNVSLAILRNAQRGTLAQRSKDGKKISWMLTQSGLEAVRQMLSESDEFSEKIHNQNGGRKSA